MKVKRLKEVWKDIPDYEGYYKVSNLGRVRSVDRGEVHKNGRGYLRKGRVLKPGLHTGGYLVLTLCKPNEKRQFYVHRLVLEAFIGLCPDGMEACHNDGVRTNNSIYNLRWDTLSANQNDRKKHGTDYYPRGEQHRDAKLTEEDVIKIRTEYPKGDTSYSKLGKKFGVSKAVIGYIIRRETWTYI